MVALVAMQLIADRRKQLRLVGVGNGCAGRACRVGWKAMGATTNLLEITDVVSLQPLFKLLTDFAQGVGASVVDGTAHANQRRRRRIRIR